MIMALRINTNVEALNVQRNLVDTGVRVADSLKRLSSGKRINSARDDASGFAVANKFRADISSMRVAYQNASEAQGMLQTADGAYNKIHDILVRMKDLATQGASGQTDGTKLQSEFGLLQSEIDRISGSTKYGATTLINSATTVTFQVGQTNATNNQMAVAMSAATTDLLGVDSTDIANVTAVNRAQSAMDRLDTALGSINQYMGAVGAYQNRLQYTMENIAVSIENFSASESTIRDVDMAYEVMNFTKNQILQQTGMAMMAQANAAPQQVLTLLR
jgi:flagellin